MLGPSCAPSRCSSWTGSRWSGLIDENWRWALGFKKSVCFGGSRSKVHGFTTPTSWPLCHRLLYVPSILHRDFFIFSICVLFVLFYFLATPLNSFYIGTLLSLLFFLIVTLFCLRDASFTSSVKTNNIFYPPLWNLTSHLHYKYLPPFFIILAMWSTLLYVLFGFLISKMVSFLFVLHSRYIFLFSFFLHTFTFSHTFIGVYFCTSLVLFCCCCCWRSQLLFILCIFLLNPFSYAKLLSIL